MAVTKETSSQSKVCSRCGNEILGDDIHLAYPDGFLKLCAIVINIKSEDK